jgi:hypothetical protein
MVSWARLKKLQVQHGCSELLGVFLVECRYRLIPLSLHRLDPGLVDDLRDLVSRLCLLAVLLRLVSLNGLFRAIPTIQVISYTRV